VILKLQCGINRELIGWIFQWMSNVKVKQPKRLQQFVMDKYRDCFHLYQTGEELVYKNSFAKRK